VLVGTITRDSAWGELFQSEPFHKDPVFRYADFKTIQDLLSWENDKLIASGECLFVSPASDEAEFNIERENELADTRKGGFACVLWRK
jgi:hypothetical protein